MFGGSADAVVEHQRELMRLCAVVLAGCSTTAPSLSLYTAAPLNPGSSHSASERRPAVGGSSGGHRGYQAATGAPSANALATGS
jgi:hypothetical protein